MIRDAAMQWIAAIRGWRRAAQHTLDLAARRDELAAVERTESYVLRRLWESLG